jgi:hypothetical protein
MLVTPLGEAITPLGEVKHSGLLILVRRKNTCYNERVVESSLYEDLHGHRYTETYLATVIRRLTTIFSFCRRKNKAYSERNRSSVIVITEAGQRDNAG